MTAGLGGLIVAGGMGQRMGGPKALLQVNGEPLIRLHKARLLEVGCARVVVVVPPQVVQQVRAWVPEACVVGVVSRSQAESVLIGSSALAGVDVVVVTPVDAMPVRAETLRQLLGAMRDSVVAVTPRFQGHGGHPVVIRREAIGAPMESLHACLEALGQRRVRVSVDDPAVADDFDTPADLAGFYSQRRALTR